MGKGKKGKKGGKKRKNKEAEEVERLAREEEERQRLEAEKLRLEQERLEKEKRDKENEEIARQMRQEELTRLKSDEDEISSKLLHNNGKVLKAVDRKQEREDWEVFTQCSNKPKISSKAELNTYLNEWLIADVEDLEIVLQQCQESIDIKQNIDKYLGSVYFHVHGNNKEFQEYQNYNAKLKNAEVRKLDYATAYILRHPEDFVTPKNEIFVCKSTKDIKYGLWGNLASKGFRMKTIEFPELGIMLEIPKALALQNIAVRVMYIARGCNIGASKASEKSMLGGSLSVEVLQLPPPSKSVKGWIMRPVGLSKEHVERVVYPLGTPGENSTITSATNTGTMTIKFSIPDNVYIDPGFLQIGWWNDKAEAWSQEGIQDISLNERTITFQATILTTFVLLQPKALDFPLRNWSVAPHLDGSIHIMLEGPRFTIELEVFNGTCKILKPTLACLEDLYDKTFEPGVLLNQLAIRGINLRATLFDADNAPWRSNIKNTEIESQIYENIGKIVSAFTICSTPWNQKFDNTKFCILHEEPSLVESAETDVEIPKDTQRTIFVCADGELEFGLKYFLVQQEDLEYVQSMQQSQDISTILNLRKVVSHIQLENLFHANNMISDEASKGMEEAPVLQQVAVSQLLKIIQPLSTTIPFDDALQLQEGHDTENKISIPDTKSDEA